MNRLHHARGIALLILLIGLIAYPANAQDKAPQVPKDKIVALQSKLDEAGKSKSSARKRLALRRVIRECESLLTQHKTAPNRFEVLGVLFNTQRSMVKLDGSAQNRAAFLETCKRLAAAPDAYAVVRLEADMLLSQTELARKGADLKQRSRALKLLVDRYLGTPAQKKMIKIAMVMALEYGEAALIQHLREVIAQRMAGDLELINFQRDRLAGQVFGAPFVGRFKRADGKVVRLPMDTLGKTTGVVFWSKDNGGIDTLKEIAAAWKANKASAERDPSIRYQFISINVDGLPDAGESILREAGLDWPALHLPGGRKNPVYTTYARGDPKVLTLTPSGYAAMTMSGTSWRPPRGYDRIMGSWLARSWSKERYNSQFQSLLAGEFLVIESRGAFQPSFPPELQAVQTASGEQAKPIKRTAASVPEDKLQAIQACFIKAPLRYRLLYREAVANLQKAEKLCREAIAAHPDADDLWIVRNRRIVALMGLWKLEGKRKHFDDAVLEARTAIQKGYPKGTDIIARFCLAREALRAEDADSRGLVQSFAKTQGTERAAVTRPALASLLALDIADRSLHERYRRISLDKHANHPALWTATAFFLDRYHRYWMYHPPFTAGWTYGRRQGYFLAIGDPEDANRSLQAEFKTLDGETVKIPDVSNSKWTVIEFGGSGGKNWHLRRYGTFVDLRPFPDINRVAVVLNDNAEAVKAEITNPTKKGRPRTPDPFPILLLPDGMNSPAVQQLGILAEDTRPNLVLLRPDGSIAACLSGLSMSAQNGNVIQNVIELHDEKKVEEALARGDLKEAKRLAFAFAPLPVPEPVEPEPADGKKKKKVKKKPAVKISVPHLRARARVYIAMKDWGAAKQDVEQVYLSVKQKAGWLSMRTADLAEAEQLKAVVLKALTNAQAGK